MGQKILISVPTVVVVLLALPIAMQLLKGSEPAVATPPPAEAAPADPAPAPVQMAQAYTAPAPSPGPQIVWMQPTNGATNVSPMLDRLVVTFDRPMGGGFSWTGGGEQYPEGTGRPFWSPDGYTCTLPVRLRPNWSYRLGLNSPSHKNFKAQDGTPLTPTQWTFQTGG